MLKAIATPSYGSVIGAPKGYAGYMVAIGDSIIGNAISNGGTAPAYQTYLHQRGFLNIFQSLYNNPFEMPVRYQGATLAYGANAGIGGEFTRQGLARLQSDVLVQNPSDVWWNFGTNDVKNDYTAANVFANTIAAYHACMKSGVRRFWCPGVFPRNNDGGVAFSAGQEAIRLAYNLLLAQFEAANSGSFIYINPDPAMMDPATGLLYSDYSYDGLHPNSRGAYAFALSAIGLKYESLGGRFIPKAITPDYNASTNPYGNLFANGAFDGATGTATSRASGTLPTSWNSSFTAGTTATAVWSIVSEANASDTIVNKAKSVLTSDGLSADTETLQLKPATTDTTTGVVAGGWYETEIEIDVEALSGNEILRSFYLSMTDQTTGGERVRVFSSRYTSGGTKDKFFTDAAETFIIKTPPIYVKGTTGIRVSLNVDIDGTVSGTRTILVSSPILRAVPPPFIRYEDSSRIHRLFVIRDADMQSTSDRIFEKTFRGTNYIITNVLAVRKSGGTSVACAGGIYTASGKGGTALVANTQDWVSLTGAGKAVKATLASAANTDTQSAVPYFSLTTGSTAAATADIFIYGFVIE